MSWRGYDQPPPKRYRPDPGRGWMPGAPYNGPPNRGPGGPPNRHPSGVPNRGPGGPPPMPTGMRYNPRDNGMIPGNRGPIHPNARGPPIMHNIRGPPGPVPPQMQRPPPPPNNVYMPHPQRPQGYPPNNVNHSNNNNDMMHPSRSVHRKIRKTSHISDKNMNNDNATTQVMHISKGENNDEFAIVLSQIFGSPLIDSIPCGETVKDSIVFDGRIKLELILRYLPHAINSPKKTVRVFEVSCLASQDQKNYNEFVNYYTKIERACVVDKEYDIGIILYLIPPKLLKSQFDFSKIKRKNDRKSRKKKKDIFSKGYNDDNIDPSLLRGPISIHEYLGFERASTNAWVICITSKSKILKHKMKLQAKKQQQQQQETTTNNNETKSNENNNSTNIENENDKDLGFLSDTDSENNFEQKTNENEPKSELLIELEKLYNKLGKSFNYPKQFE